MLVVLAAAASVLLLVLLGVGFFGDWRAERVRALLAARRYEAALALLGRTPAGRAGRSADLWFRALALEGLGRTAEALATLRAMPILEIRTTRWYSASEVLRRLAEWSERAGEPFEAIKWLAMLRDRGFDTARVRYLMARNFLAMSDYAKALHYADAALAKDRRMHEARLLKGRVFYEAGRYAEALAEFKRSGRSPEALTWTGMTYYRMDLYLPAAKTLRRVFPPPEPLKDEHAFCLGSSLFHLGDFAGAYKQLSRLASLEATRRIPYREVHYRLAVSAERLGKFDEAVEWWEFLADRDPKYLDVAHRLVLAKAYRASDAFRVYLFSPGKRFRVLAGLMLKRLGYRTVKMEEPAERILDVAAERPEEEGEVERVFFRFVRNADPVDRTVLKIVHERMRDHHAREAVLFAAGPLAVEVSGTDGVLPVTVKGHEETARLAEQVFEEYRRYSMTADGEAKA